MKDVHYCEEQSWQCSVLCSVSSSYWITACTLATYCVAKLFCSNKPYRNYTHSLTH